MTDGYELAPATGAAETITSVTGLAPTDVAIEGNQLFDVYDTATGQATGAFEGEVTNTSDVLLNYTEEILVTGDVSGTVGTATGRYTGGWNALQRVLPLRQRQVLQHL